MKNQGSTIIYAVLVTAFLSFSISSPAAAADSPDVRALEVRGLKKIEEGAVRKRITQGLGQPLSVETVSEDIKAIYGMGYFEDVKVEVEPFEGGVRLAYIVREKPQIRRVDIFGNEELEESKLREKLTISPGSLADVVLIQSNADVIRLTYEEEGYPLAAVVPIVGRITEGHALLTYYIREGPKVKIRNIVIEGNREISAGDIKDAIESSEWGLFAWATKVRQYKKAVLAEDVERIKNLYHDRGYIKAVVSEPVVEMSEDRRRVDIAVAVKEGDRYRVSRVGFGGNTVFSEEELTEGLSTAPGEFVSKKALGSDVAAITEKYTERGYALASIQPDIEPDDEKKEAGVTFRIYEDEIYHVGRVEISGNEKTRDKVIRREMRLDEGDLFNSKLLRRSYQRLLNLNFFEEVKLNPIPRAERKRLDLDIQVAERSTGYLNVGGGYSSVDKFVGMVDVTQGNLGGRGQYIKASSEFSSRSTLYEISFREPWLFDRPVSLDVSVFRTKREYTNYTRKSDGFSLGLGRRFAEYWRTSATYRYENVQVLEVSESASELIREQEGQRVTSSISPALARDSRDNFLDPHTGSRNAVYLTYAGLGGDNRFIKASLVSSWHLPVSRSTTFSLRGNFAYAAGVAGEELPLYERYYVGGGMTVRGLRDVGPKDEQGIYIGGTKKLVFNFDYTFPLVSDINLKGGVFYDLGTAYDTSIHMKDSAGAGIRWISPIGPIRLDWAKIIEPEADEPDYRWEFSIGSFF